MFKAHSIVKKVSLHGYFCKPTQFVNSATLEKIMYFKGNYALAMQVFILVKTFTTNSLKLIKMKQKIYFSLTKL